MFHRPGSKSSLGQPSEGLPPPLAIETAIYAHRGACHPARENTIAAFERATALGADGIEFDVRCTIDRVLVIYHDAEIAGQSIDQLTWAELQAIDAEIPTLEQVVGCFANRILLDVEIKESGYEAEVLLALQPLALDRFVITSFRLAVLDRIKQLNPQIMAGFLIDARTIEQFPDAHFLNEQMNAIGIDFLALQWQILNHAIVTQLVPQTVWIWTVNQAIVMQQLLTEAKTLPQNRQIVAIITDELEMGFACRTQTSPYSGVT